METPFDVILRALGWACLMVIIVGYLGIAWDRARDVWREWCCGADERAARRHARRIFREGRKLGMSDDQIVEACAELERRMARR